MSTKSYKNFRLNLQFINEQYLDTLIYQVLGDLVGSVVGL